MAFSALTNAETAADRFITQTLMRKIKNNLDALYGVSAGLPIVVNGSFEIDSDGDGVPDNWTVTTYTGGSVVASSSSPLEGQRSLRIIHPGGAGNGGGYADSDYVSCTPVSPVKVKWINSNTTAHLHNEVLVRWFDQDKGFISASTVYASTAVPSSTARQFSGIVSAPSSGRFFKIRIIGGTTDTNSSGIIKFDNVEYERIDYRRVTIPNTSQFIIKDLDNTRKLTLKFNNAICNVAGVNYGFRINFSTDNGVTFPATGIYSDAWLFGSTGSTGSSMNKTHLLIPKGRTPNFADFDMTIFNFGSSESKVTGIVNLRYSTQLTTLVSFHNYNFMANSYKKYNALRFEPGNGAGSSGKFSTGEVIINKEY